MEEKSKKVKPRLLDLFCGAGGASMGYHRAGFEVEGVDIKPQPNYPFKFYLDDALHFPLEGYNAYHASPPCQAYTWASGKARHLQGYNYPDLLSETRHCLLSTGNPFIIENVPNSPLENYIELSGWMFGLKVIRRRWFECHGFDILLLPPPARIKSPIQTGKYFTVAGHGGDSKDFRLKTWQTAMGIDWMKKEELTQSIPPAYTEYIGKFLMANFTKCAQM